MICASRMLQNISPLSSSSLNLAKTGCHLGSARGFCHLIDPSDGSGQIRSSSTHHLALYIRRCRWFSARYPSAKYSLVPQCRYDQTLKVLQPEFYNCSQGYQKAKVVTSQLQHCVCKSACLKSKNYQTTKT